MICSKIKMRHLISMHDLIIDMIKKLKASKKKIDKYLKMIKNLYLKL